MRVTDVSSRKPGGRVWWVSIDNPNKTGDVPVENWERRYRPFTAPEQTNTPVDGAEGK